MKPDMASGCCNGPQQPMSLGGPVCITHHYEYGYWLSNTNKNSPNKKRFCRSEKPDKKNRVEMHRYFDRNYGPWIPSEKRADLYEFHLKKGRIYMNSISETGEFYEFTPEKGGFLWISSEKTADLYEFPPEKGGFILIPSEKRADFMRVRPLTSGSLVLCQPLEGEEAGDGLVHQLPQYRLVQARLPPYKARSSVTGLI